MTGSVLVKSCLYGQPYVLFVLCLFVILVMSHSGYEGETLVLTAPVPGHCLHLYFTCTVLIDMLLEVLRGHNS